MKKLKRSGDKIKLKGFTIKIELINEEWILTVSFFIFSVRINITDLINRE